MFIDSPPLPGRQRDIPSDRDRLGELGLPSPEKESAHEYENDTRDHEHGLYLSRRGQQEHIKIDENRRCLNGHLLNRDYIAGLAESKGHLRLPHAQHVRTDQDQARRDEYCDMRARPLAAQNDEDHGQERAYPEVGEAEGKAVREPHDDALPSPAPERKCVSRHPDGEKAQGEKRHPRHKVGVREGMEHLFALDAQLAQPQQGNPDDHEADAKTFRGPQRFLVDPDRPDRQHDQP
jgi:hypothetical protein